MICLVDFSAVHAISRPSNPLGTRPSPSGRSRTQSPVEAIQAFASPESLLRFVVGPERAEVHQRHRETLGHRPQEHPQLAWASRFPCLVRRRSRQSYGGVLATGSSQMFPTRAARFCRTSPASRSNSRRLDSAPGRGRFSADCRCRHPQARRRLVIPPPLAADETPTRTLFRIPRSKKCERSFSRVRLATTGYDWRLRPLAARIFHLHTRERFPCCIRIYCSRCAALD